MRYRSTSITTLSCSSRSRCDGDHKNAFFTAEAGRPRWQPSSAPIVPTSSCSAETRSKLRSLRGRRCLRGGRADRRKLICGHRLLRQQQRAPSSRSARRPQHFGWESAEAFKGIICDDIFSEFESVYGIARDLAKRRSLRRSDRLRNCFGAFP
jgi:hypothetical protein